VLIAITATLAAWCIHVALDRHVTDLQRLESRFALAGEYAARALPADAVVLAVQHTGSIRYHGHRDTIAWDAIAPDALESTIAALRARGRTVFLALEDAEEPAFRRRFAGTRVGALDWRPRAEISGGVRVRVYDVP
jgi:hypothetical protein